MSGLLDLLAPALSGKSLDTIGSQLGLGKADTERGIDTALPALLTHLKGKADDPVAGPALVSAITKDHSGGILDNVGSFLGGGHSGMAEKALGLVFGNDSANVDGGPIGSIAKLAGLGGGATKGLLGMLVPLVLGAIGKSGGSSLTSGAMSNLLGGAIGQTTGGSGITKLLGGLLGGGAAAAGAAVSGVTGAAGAAVSGVTGAAGSAAKAVTGSAAKTVAAGAAVTGAAAAATRGAANSARAAVDEKRKKSPLMWLLPLLLIGALVIFGLTKCGKDKDSDDVATDTTAVVADTAAAATDTAAAVETTAAAAETVAAETVAAAPETAAAVDTTVAAAPATEAAAPATEAPAPATEAAAPSTEAPAAMNAAGDAVSEDLTVYFDTNSSAIRADQQSKIDNAVAALKGAAAGTKANLVGHADSRGNAAANEKLSQARSAAVEAAIKAGLGADAANVTFATSFEGDKKPAADLEKSRRVTVEIQK